MKFLIFINKYIILIHRAEAGYCGQEKWKPKKINGGNKRSKSSLKSKNQSKKGKEIAERRSPCLTTRKF
jgi:hypothetical protein